MNRDQRKELKRAISLMEDAALKLALAREIVETIQEEESNKFENLNDGMQAMESNQKLEAAADDLSEINSEMEDIYGEIDLQILAVYKVIEA